MGCGIVKIAARIRTPAKGRYNSIRFPEASRTKSEPVPASRLRHENQQVADTAVCPSGALASRPCLSTNGIIDKFQIGDKYDCTQMPAWSASDGASDRHGYAEL